MIWPTTAKIYWDAEYNVPLIKPPPGKDANVFELKLTEPGDARPANEKDLKNLIDAIKYEFNDLSIYKKFFENQFLLFNKVPHWDQMWEVVSSGNVLGQLYYDPFIERWRFRLNSTGAYLAAINNLVDYIVVDYKWVKEKSIIKTNFSSSARQVVIVSKDMRPLGIAENIPGEGLFVIKSFKNFIKPIETSWKTNTMQDVLKKNEYGIYYFESRAKAFIYSMYSKVGKEVIVSYSGGKDSLVSLHLTLSTIGKVKILFNNTGLELPETLENVEYVSDKYDIETVVADAGEAFWRNVEIFGPPGKDYRWCCKIAKLVPLARIARNKWPQGALNIVGQRAFESIDRAKSPRVWRNKWIPNLLSISPIQEWSQLHVWLYIYKYKLPYNKAYDLGFERLGCYLCPSSTLAEFKTLEETHQELWSKWYNVLETWRKRLDQPIEWIKYGLWRWLTPSRAKYRLIHRIENYEINWFSEYTKRLLHGKLNLAPIRSEKKALQGVIEFNKELIPLDALTQFESNVRMLKYNITQKKHDNAIQYSISTQNADIFVEKNTIRYELKNEKGIEDVFNIVKIIYRIHGCAKCGSCIVWCPNKAIKLTAFGPVPEIPCSSCRICIDVCPVADVLVEKVVIPLILEKYDAWRRPTKAYREDVLESFRSMGLIP
ncbi:phosphoadenosine phosphosulfate reductase family protein [Desulfurococcaceae archaeon MEX13E-LK6-19]|nr:phosphoadenosine phosphosulfate reductase family protein [Desulfurococcaceae archaeon MEX13E-LK6-19]